MAEDTISCPGFQQAELAGWTVMMLIGASPIADFY